MTTYRHDPASVDVKAFMAGRLRQGPAVISSSSQTTGDANGDRSVQPSQMNASTQRQEFLFMKAMDRFRDQAIQAGDLKEFDIRHGRYSWHSVLVTAEVAAAQYEAKASKGFSKMFTRFGRRLGEQEAQANAWLSLMPSGEYTSIVCGSLILLITACQHMKNVREAIMDALNEAPHYLQQAQIFQNIYPADARLDVLVEELYFALLVAIQKMIDFFGHGKGARFRAFFEQDFFGKQYRAEIANVGNAVAKLREHADVLDKEATADTQRVVLAAMKLAKMTQQTVDLNFATTKDIHAIVKGVSSKQNDSSFALDRIENILSRFEKCFAGAEQQMTWQVAAYHAEQARFEELRQQQALLEYQEILPVLSQRQIIEMLDDAGGQVDEKINKALDSARILNAGPELAVALTKATKFRKWLTSASSQILCVDQLGSLSPQAGSFVSASLIQALRNRRYAIPLLHFCSEEQVDSQQVTGFLANVTCQLLRACPDIDLTAWSKRRTILDHQSSITNRELSYLCSLLKYLVLRIPYGTVFIFIDEFHTMERFADPAEVTYLFEKLREIMNQCPSREAPARMFKVLCMSAKPRLGGIVSMDVEDKDFLEIDVSGEDDVNFHQMDEVSRGVRLDSDEETGAM